MMLVYGIWSLQLLVSTALLAKVLASSEKKLDTFDMKKSYCDILEDSNQDHTCSHLFSGVVS